MAPRRFKARSIHRGQCLECNPGYDLNAETCGAFTCTTGPEEACKALQLETSCLNLVRCVVGRLLFSLWW